MSETIQLLSDIYNDLPSRSQDKVVGKVLKLAELLREQEMIILNLAARPRTIISLQAGPADSKVLDS